MLFTFWQMYPTVLLEMLCKTEVQVSGDPIYAGETSVLVMNHRTRTDWNFLWPAVYHCIVGNGRFKHPLKFVLKDVIRHIPGPGWVMQLACFLYIKRSWDTDKKKLENLVDYFSQLKYKFSLILFPEGTDFTPKTKEISHRFAEKNCLQKYEHVLHPRTTGFTCLARRLIKNNNLNALYDVTLVYCDTVPQNEKYLLNGNFPKIVKMHFARYPTSILPKTEEGLKQFLERRWLEKENIIKEFYATGKFLHGKILKRNQPLEMYVTLIFWTFLPYFIWYVFIYVEFFRNIVIAHTIFLLVINYISDGFQDFEISVHRFRRRIFRRYF